MMDIDNTDFSENLKLTIENSNFLKLKATCLNDIVEENLKSVINLVLNKVERPSWNPIIYSIVKELVINACKANQKRIFFEEKGLNLTSKNDYTVGMLDYKKTFTEADSQYYSRRCKELDLFCEISFNYSNQGIKIEIMNNSEIMTQEEKSIREKLEAGMICEDIAEYFNNFSGETEGAGIGLIMILMMLKTQGIDPNNFRFIPKKDKTIARVEFPFSITYQSVR